MRISDWSSDVCSSDLVAGVDGAGERILALDREDVGNLHDVELGGDARRDVLARGGRGRQAGVVIVHQLGDQRRDVFRETVRVGRIIRDMDLAHAGYLAGLFADAAAFLAGDPQMDLAPLARGGYAGQ